ncbi:MAG TPA: TspO/MBR family protein [Longimicrobiales bacterium]|nr:TspO/MBR family protein [Longimicrobiales bacterium]
MKWVALVVWVALPLLIGAGAGGLFQPGEWYARLNKPDWNPPSWVFGPVWTTLYVLMGVAAWLVWERHGFTGAARTALVLFLVHLLFNAAWSALFFGLESPGLAFAEILVLWAMIGALIVLFWRLRPAAGALLVPYLAWVSFAAVLNYTIWRLN